MHDDDLDDLQEQYDSADCNCDAALTEVRRLQQQLDAAREAYFRFWKVRDGIGKKLRALSETRAA